MLPAKFTEHRRAAVRLERRIAYALEQARASRTDDECLSFCRLAVELASKREPATKAVLDGRRLARCKAS